MPDTTSTEAPVSAAGWELHYGDRRSDKYYRIMLAGHVVVVNYGRTGTAGSLVVHDMGTPARARGKALTLTAEKEAKGYRLARETAGFQAPAGLVQSARGGGGRTAEAATARELVLLFLSASAGAAR